MQLENTPVHRSLLPMLILECSEDQSRFRGTMKIRVRYFLSMRHKAAIVTLYTLEDTVLWYELGVMSGLRCQMTKGQRWQKFLVVVVSRLPADAASQREVSSKWVLVFHSAANQFTLQPVMAVQCSLLYSDPICTFSKPSDIHFASQSVLVLYQ